MRLAKKKFENFLITLTFCSCFLSPPTRADNADSATKSNASSSSAISSNRNGRIITAQAGVGYFNGIAKFASAGYQVTPDWVLEAYYEKSETFFFGTSTSRAIRSKNFWTTNLYTNVGLMHRQTSGRSAFLDVLSSTFTGKETHYDIEYWDVGPGFSIGNQWQWSAFHVGCDWIGVYWPLYASAAKVIKTEGSEISRKTTDDDLKPEPSARLLRLYLGMSI